MTLSPLRQIRPCLNTPILHTRHSHSILFCSIHSQLQRRAFHASLRDLSDTFPNHYATLDLPTSAGPAEIKKQFYALSKKYHPDVNPDPTASERFVKISEAY